MKEHEKLTDPYQTTPSCSVVVCTRNRAEQLDRCLEGLRQLCYPAVAVLVVEGAPSDGSARAVAERWGARYLVEPLPGLSRARNRAARECQTEIVAFLDDDSLPEPDWLTALVRPFADPAVMAVTGRILPLSFNTEAQHRFEFASGYDVTTHIYRAVDKQTPFWFEMTNFGGLGNGGNLAIRRKAFEVWPGFDGRLGRGTAMNAGEDNYALFSLVARGYRVVHTPEAVVRHPYPKSLAQLRARHLRGLSEATAYVLFLLVEARGYRTLTLRYILEALRGVPRSWRTNSPSSEEQIVPRWWALLAQFSGPLRYLQSLAKTSSWPEGQARGRQEDGVRCGSS